MWSLTNCTKSSISNALVNSRRTTQLDDRAPQYHPICRRCTVAARSPYPSARPARPGRQVDLAPLRAARGPGRGALDAQRITHQVRIASRRSPASVGWASRFRKTMDGSVTAVWDEVRAAPFTRRARSTPATPEPRCGCWRALLAGQPFREPAGRRRIAVAASDAPRDRAARHAWARESTRRRPCSACRSMGRGFRGIVHRPRSRAPRSRARCCSPACTPRGTTSVAEPAADPRPHRARAGRVRRIR